MDNLKSIASDYSSFYAGEGKVSVIMGNAAKRFADAIKEEKMYEQDIKFVTIDPDSTALGANDATASRAVVEVLTQLAEQNGTAIVVVIDKKASHINGHLGLQLGRKATNITHCDTTEKGTLHITDTKIRTSINPVDEEVEP